MKRVFLFIALFVLFFITSCNENIVVTTQPIINESTTTEPNTVYVPSTTTLQTYTVTFDSNGGSPIESQQIEKGSNVARPEDPAKEGYAFDGWYVGDEKWSFINNTVTTNLTLKAKWINIMVTVSKTIRELAYNWANGTQYLSFKLEGTAEGVVTVTAAGGSNAGKYYTSGYEWRLYNGGSETPDSMTISVPEGYKLVSVKITYNSGSNGILVLGDAAFASGSVDTTCAGKTSVTFKAGNSGTATNGQAKITAIEVVYIPPKETA